MNIIGQSAHIPGMHLARSTLVGLGVISLTACGGGGDDLGMPDAALQTEAPPASALSKRSATSLSVSVLAYKSKVAIADFVDVSPDGCTWTYAQIVAGVSSVPGSGAQGADKGLNVYGLIYNACNETYDPFYAGGDLHARVFIDERRTTAKGTFMGQFNDGSAKSVEVNLSWNGGVATSDKTRTVTIGPEVKLINRTSSSFKFADSVTGSIVIDGEEYLSPDRNSGVTGYTAQNGETTIQIVRKP